MQYHVRFWFDFSSPFAYLAATQVESLCARNNATLQWSPILLGGLFRELGQANVPLFAMSPEKQVYVGKDIERWAWWWGVPFQFSPHFPLRTVLPLRVALGMAAPGPFIRSVFRAAWAEGKNIADPQVLVECGATPDQIEAAQHQKAALQASTDEARARGVFGVPTFDCRLGDRQWRFWGQDRIALLESCLQGVHPPEEDTVTEDTAC